MSLKQMPIRYTEEERVLLEKLAELTELEITNAVRLAIKEALEKRGVTVPATAFGKKQEGRPKETALIAFNTSAVLQLIAAR